ncbi:MAG: porin [Cryobacterium sp.]|nr:porin [Oligoflexia bacterium]
MKNDHSTPKFLILALAFTTSIAVRAAKAEVEKSPAPPFLDLSASFDFYYQASPQGHSPSPAPAGPRVMEGRYFDRNVNQMTLNMAEITVKKKVDKVSFQAGFAFGEMMDELSGGGSQSVTGSGAGLNPTNAAANEPTRNITQATVTYAPTDRLAITVGKFYSFVGLEATKAKDSWQYSRSYLYNYGPFWHQGMNVNGVIVPNQFSVTGYVLNGWDGRISAEQNRSATLGLNLNYTGIENLVVNYNYIGGIESTGESRREAHELNATYTISPAFAVAVDALTGIQRNIVNVGNATWSGIAVYLKANVNNVYSISPRVEFFDDSAKGFAISGGFGAPGVKQNITAYTLTNRFDLGHGLETRIEIRSDHSSSDEFFKAKDGGPSNHQESGTLAFLYAV